MKPIRCYTCGKVLGNRWCVVDKRLSEGVPMKQVYEEIGLSRYCCKRTVVASYDTTTHAVDDRPMSCLPETVRMTSTSSKPNFLKIT